MRKYIIIIVLLIALSLIGCEENSESEQVRELRNQVQKLQSENERLKEDYRRIQMEYDQLKKVYNLPDFPPSRDGKKSSGIFDEVFR